MLSKKDQLRALSWKCDQLDISYGKLMNQASPYELHEIYAEYERMLKKHPAAGMPPAPPAQEAPPPAESEYKAAAPEGELP